MCVSAILLHKSATECRILLTAEFVVEGEQVKQGQTIGTVGSSATFEIADEPHLHFEILKDSIYVDPSIYIK